MAVKRSSTGILDFQRAAGRWKAAGKHPELALEPFAELK
jgi:hypothetical protein